MRHSYHPDPWGSVAFYRAVWNEDYGLIIFHCNGYILSREEFQDLSSGMWNFYKELSDEDIARWNDEITAYHRQRDESKKKESKHDEGYVYLIQADNGLTKIGKSKTKKRRTEQLDITLPYETKLLGTIKSSKYSALEKELHDRYESKRIRGEWFDLDKDDVKEILAINNHISSDEIENERD